jgi:hypothetical protein
MKQKPKPHWKTCVDWTWRACSRPLPRPPARRGLTVSLKTASVNVTASTRTLASTDPGLPCSRWAMKGDYMDETDGQGLVIDVRGGDMARLISTSHQSTIRTALDLVLSHNVNNTSSCFTNFIELKDAEVDGEMR